MVSSSRHHVTRLLGDLCGGNREVEDDLFEHLYAELRERARQQRRRWNGSPVLQTTALAHEAYLKLVGREERSWKSRSHFFAVAARAMRQILINEAEAQRAEKRGGDSEPRSLEALREALGREVVPAEEKAEAFTLLGSALRRFEKEKPRAARVVECRFFAGMTIGQTAEALGVSGSTVSRDWDLAQGWLYREMRRIRNAEAPSETDSPEEDEDA